MQSRSDFVVSVSVSLCLCLFWVRDI
jgi:hypothetical protein